MGKSVPTVMAVQTLFFWVIAVVFLFVGYSKLHILWIVAISVLASFYLVLGLRLPIISLLVLWLTGLLVEILVLGLKRRNAGPPSGRL